MVSMNSHPTNTNTPADVTAPDSNFLRGMQAWQNKKIRKAGALFKTALECEKLTPAKFQDMGEFFRVAAHRNNLAAACYEKSISAATEARAPVPDNVRVNLSRCLYQQWDRSFFKKPDLLQKAGDQLACVLNNTKKPLRVAFDYKLFSEPTYPNPQQAAAVGLRLSKLCANTSVATSILAHVAADLSTRYKQQPFGLGQTSYLHARYRPAFSNLSQETKEAIAEFLYAHRNSGSLSSHSEAYTALAVIPKEQIPQTTAKIESERAKLAAKQYDQKIIAKYIKG